VIKARLAWLQTQPDGEIERCSAGQLTLVVIKHGTQIGLFFKNQRGTLDGPMSRIDIEQPLTLLAPYTQALLLALLWQPTPARIAVLGFGGGRIPLVLHQHLPNTLIESVDIDPAFVRIAERFFGVAYDSRQQVHIGDGRAFLNQVRPRYDIIIVDAFSDASDNLDHLATVEFYQICRKHLTPSGLLAINMLRSDVLVAPKVSALATIFPELIVCPLLHSLVFFAPRQPRQRPLPIAQRAFQLEAQLGAGMPLVARARELRRFRFDEEDLPIVVPLFDAHLLSEPN
jgi:spermidine synthase